MTRPSSRLSTLFLAVLAAGAFFMATAPIAAAQTRSGSCRTVCVETRFVETGGVRYAYRVIGDADGPPLVMMNRFRGVMDEWDPAFVDRLADSRTVILFDNAGVARSSGTPSPRLAGWADNTAAFVAALGYKKVDVFGFSLGGLMAQELAYRHPSLVRRLIIAGSGAGYVEGYNVRPEAIAVATKPVNVEEDFLYLFFRNTPTSQAAGRAHLARLRQRQDAFASLVSADAWRAMLSAASDVGTPETSLLNRAPDLKIPVLVANGVEDVMIPTYQSFALAQALPNATLIVYPDSGHAFMFQFPEAFAAEVNRFLE
ncbi:alpha/beta hydrolase [Brevundimonas sp.]|jgi:pimeloyl-ACP methyl ester carboxylesterase|uniref:alpha/beta fold hydrolase n=1 Tax=Brevundimonas sp. TaxID=1871086 RepID=UPI0025C496A8|nr:alpha/beta hydrolase [Brevundimonas sp.]